jgi:hypothetical protein
MDVSSHLFPDGNRELVTKLDAPTKPISSAGEFATQTRMEQASSNLPEEVSRRKFAMRRAAVFLVCELDIKTGTQSIAATKTS